MKLLDHHVFGATISLPDLPEYRKFYRKLDAGAWEPHTFALLAENLDRNTVYLDIGAWIGVTPFWASHLAKAVIAVEPDPRARAILKAGLLNYPNVTLLEGALSPQPEVEIHAVGGFGSSETSVLAIGNGGSAKVPGLTFGAMLEGAGDDRIFVKIDIEGYEYEIIEMLSELKSRQLAGIQIAIHPQLYERSLSGPPALRRLRTLWMTFRLHRRLAQLCPPARIRKYRSLAHYLAAGILWARRPRGTDFVFIRPACCWAMPILYQPARLRQGVRQP
jgi:FkbM family methyltransferase